MEAFMYAHPIQAIYSLRNKITQHLYIGGTRNYGHRIVDHLYRLRKGIHWINKLQLDFSIFGENSFEFIVLERLENKTKTEIEAKEQIWLDYFHPEYNLSPIAGSCIADNARTPEALEKMRKALTGKMQPIETIAKRSATAVRNGKHRNKILTVEQRQHLGDMNSGVNNPNWGKHRETTKKKRDAKGLYYIGVISPDGQVFTKIYSMNKFCAEHGLSESCMVALINGRRKYYKGWKYLEDEN
jgi:group I intron endonuclease